VHGVAARVADERASMETEGERLPSGSGPNLNLEY
jgi:hypothetical protein